jgi:RNA polymerase sigma-70 factor (ECF subfamily)
MSSEELFQRIRPHLPSLRRLCISLLRNSADAEDVVQETLLKAFTKIHQLRDGESIKAWLMQIAVNEARMRMRDRRRFSDPIKTGASMHLDHEEAQPSALDTIPDPKAPPDALLEQRQQGKAIKVALDRLELKYREVFVLRDMLGIAGTDAAAILGIPAATLHTRLKRARGQMRKMLAPYVGSDRARWRPIRMMTEMVKMRRMKAVSCRKVRKEMGRYLDNELYGEILRDIEAHVKVCSRCYLLLDTTRKTLQLVADEKLLDMPFLCGRDWSLVVTEFTKKPTGTS